MSGAQSIGGEGGSDDLYPGLSLSHGDHFLMSSTVLSTFLPARSNGPSLQQDSPAIRAMTANTAMICLQYFSMLYLLSRMAEQVQETVPIILQRKGEIK